MGLVIQGKADSVTDSTLSKSFILKLAISSLRTPKNPPESLERELKKSSIIPLLRDNCSSFPTGSLTFYEFLLTLLRW